jgi:pyrimidine-nucleoside phosphorylase
MKTLEKFRAIVAQQGGNPAVADDLSILPKAAHSVGVKAIRAGYVTAVDCEKVGIASLVMGGGRRRKEDDIDPAVGVRVLARRGTLVGPDDDVAVIEYNADASLDEARAMLRAAFEIGDSQVDKGPLVIETIRGVLA